jgi:hypothetical protein
MSALGGKPRPVDIELYRAAVSPSTSHANQEKPMCPMCITTALLIVGSVTSTGGLAAIAIRKFGVKNAADDDPADSPPKLSR